MNEKYSRESETVSFSDFKHHLVSEIFYHFKIEDIKNICACIVLLNKKNFYWLSLEIFSFLGSSYLLKYFRSLSENIKAKQMYTQIWDGNTINLYCELNFHIYNRVKE